MINRTKYIWKPLLRRAITGRWKRGTMRPGIPPFPENLKNPGLYLHVPFCKNLCPFCPYNRVEYDEGLYERYNRAVHQEIDLYAPYIGNLDFVSLYIGGGTPTVRMDGLAGIIGHIISACRSVGDICIELHPSNMDRDCLSLLKKCGVTRLSIGVESTGDRLLETIGRSHDGKTALESLERAVSSGFDSVNADLMFVLPGQTIDDWKNDLLRVLDAGVDQVSTYPLFSFPYSDEGVRRRLKKVRRPDEESIKYMLELTTRLCGRYGLERVAVWSWLRPGKKKFSSITRHHYIGFGPSAASMTGTHFYVNTFDVDAYAGCLPGKRPVSLMMDVDERLEMAYWLYWRIYELSVTDAGFDELFPGRGSLRTVFGKTIRPFLAMGLVEKTGSGFAVTEKGSYWIHRLQNEYSLNYINRLWGASRKRPWPDGVRL